MRQSLLPVRGERLPLALIGIVQIAGSQFFSTVGLQYVAAGRTVVLLYTMQLWALPLGWLINRERISLRALCGGAVGFLGLFLFFNPPAMNWRDPQVLLGNCLCLSAGLSWALGACLYRLPQVADAILDANFLAGAVDRRRRRAPAAGTAARHPLGPDLSWP